MEDGITRNTYLALDAQLFPLLALPGAGARYGAAVMIAKKKVGYGGGFAYGEAKGGLWTEGTAQAALFMELSGRKTEAEGLIKAARAMRAEDGSYYAASTKSLPTGFTVDTDATQSRTYFHIAHLAAVSWVAIAERGFNPFTRKNRLPQPLRASRQ